MKSILYAICILFLCGCATLRQNSKKPVHPQVQLVYKEADGMKLALNGTVRDQSQEVIVHAILRLTNHVDVTLIAQTNPDGYFQFSDFPEGTYTLYVEATEYEPIQIDDWQFSKGSTVAATITLKRYEMQLLKPIIYLYPTEKQTISVKLNYDGKLDHTYPTYPRGGWNVTASPDGTLEDSLGQTYYALFWEGTPKKQIAPTDGFVVPGNQTAQFLEEKLAFLGLNRREANEFILFWLPQMENNAYNFIHFSSSDYESIAALEVTPKPTTMIRVMMLTHPMSHSVQIPTQDLRALQKTRLGYTVVEWGGSIIPPLVN